jgi:hypothetical protein
MILNDRLSEIERDPERFVREIGYNLGGGEIMAQTTVLPTRHADEFRLYVSQGNLITEMSPYSEDTEDMITQTGTHGDHARSIMLERIEQARIYLDLLERKVVTAHKAV